MADKVYRIIAADVDSAVAEAVERHGRDGHYVDGAIRARRSPKGGEPRFVDGEFRRFPEYVVVIGTER